MAKELGMDAASYEREYNGFLVKLKKFHEGKGTPFRRLPWLGGQFLDLYLLYKKVTLHGGWIKVTEDKRWREIAEVFNLPATCTNAAFALRQHYARYLEAYERINFFGEDAEDVLVSGRPVTPVSMAPFTTPSEYTSSVVPRDENRNFEKLVLSLQCGLPNEVDFAINICMLLSNVSNSVFNLTKAPAVIDMLLAHVGVFREDAHSLKDVYKEWYQKTDRDFIKFWMETLEVDEFREMFCGARGGEEISDDSLFSDGKKYGSSSMEAQRVSQVCMIMYNFSFDATNAEILARHGVCLKFLMMGICSRLGSLQSLAWNALSNLAEKMVLEPVEAHNTQIFFQVMHHFLNDKDRFRVLKAMDILGKLCTREENDTVMENALELHGYESLIRILIIPDVQLMIGSLEALYNISGVGQVTSDQIASVHHSVDTLVCMVTLDVDFFGAQALSEVQVLENRISSSIPLTPRPRPTMATPVAAPISPGPVPPQSPVASRNEIDAETFTFKWLKTAYENCPTGSVSRIDLYADYLSSCSRQARIGILNATSFNRVVKMAFPDAQLRRFSSGNQLQYALVGVRRRTTPLSIPPQAQGMNNPMLQSNPSVQDHSRTPTPPTPGQISPNWNQSQRPLPQGMSPMRPSSPTGPFQGTPNQRGTVPGHNQMPGRRNSLAGQQTPGQIQQQRIPAQFPGCGATTPGPNAGGLQKPGMTGADFLAQQMRNRNQQMLVQQRQRQVQNVPQSDAMQMQQGTPQRIAPAPTMQKPVGEPRQQWQTPTPPILPQSPCGTPSGMMPQSPVQQNPAQQGPNMQQIVRQPNAAVAQPGSQNIPRIALMPSGLPQQRVGQVPISPAPPPSMQSPAPSTSLPGPGHNERPHPGTVPIAPKQPYHIRPQRPEVQRYMQGGAPPPSPGTQNHLPGLQGRPQVPVMEVAQRGPPPTSPQVWQRTPSTPQMRTGPVPYPTQQEAAAGIGGRTYMPIAPKPMSTQSPSITTAMPPSKLSDKASEDGIVLIAREERAEDVVSADFLKHTEEQRIVVVENTNRGKDATAEKMDSSVANSNSVTKGANGYLDSSLGNKSSLPVVNSMEERTGSYSSDTLPNSNDSAAKEMQQGLGCVGLKRNNKAMDSTTVNSDGEITNSKEHNGHDTLKKPRLEERTANENSIESLPCTADVPTSLVNGGIRNDAKNKLMDKLLGKDIHMPLNGVCDINPAELELIAAEERLSSSNSKSSSPDLFGSENNSDFGKYFEESDTDTGLFSDVLSGDLRIDPVESDKGKSTEEQQKIPSLPDLGYDAVAQELRNQAALLAKAPNSTEHGVFNKGIASNMQVKVPIPSMSSIRHPHQVSPQQTQPGPNEMVLSRYGPKYQIRPQVPNHEGTWNGPVKGNYLGNVPSPQGLQPERPSMQTASQILEHRTRALVTPIASVMEPQENRQHAATPPMQPPMKTGPPPVSIPGTHAVGPSTGPGTPPPATPPPMDGTGQYFRPGVNSPAVENFKPYICRWESCTSSFDEGKQLFGHVVSSHVPRDTLIMSCSWENCPPVRRSRSSLLFHLQQKHMEPTPVTSSPHPPQLQAAQPPPTPPAPQAHNPSSFPAYHLLARMLHSLQDEEESPLAKTIRLTAALVLRNIAQYSATARSLLRRHERHLSEVAFSSSEAAHAVAACLSELSPHRKSSQSDMDNFIWTLDG